MSSSSTHHAPCTQPAEVTRSGLLELLKTVPDPRGRRGRQHCLASILALGLAAVIAGSKSFVAICEWVAHQPIETLRSLGVSGPLAPEESTIRRVFALLDADLLDGRRGVRVRPLGYSPLLTRAQWNTCIDEHSTV